MMLKIRNFLLLNLFCSLLMTNVFASETNIIGNNKHIFVLFYKENNQETSNAKNALDAALKKIENSASVKYVQINDPTEKSLIEKYEIARMPLPFIMVFAPNGAVSSSFSSQNLNEEQVSNAFTSVGMAESLKALQDRKIVFLCLQNDRTSKNQDALSGVQNFKSDSRFSKGTEIVFIDPSNIDEEKFLNQLGVSCNCLEATTVFLSPPGTTIGIYHGKTSKEQFILDLKQATSRCCKPGECCPGGKCCP